MLVRTYVRTYVPGFGAEEAGPPRRRRRHRTVSRHVPLLVALEAAHFRSKRRHIGGKVPRTTPRMNQNVHVARSRGRGGGGGGVGGGGNGGGNGGGARKTVV